MIGIGIKNAIDRVNPPFPYTLPSLAAWYARNRGITLNGGNVSQWDDQSGKGRHLKQGTASFQPSFESDNTILFDGVDNFLKADAFTLVQPSAVFLLFRQVSWTTGEYIHDGDTILSGALFQHTASPQLRINSGASVGNNSGLAVGVYGVSVAGFNGASSFIQIDNGTPVTGNAGSSGMGGFTLGANGSDSAFSNIQVKEVILLSAIPDAVTKNLIIDYLLNVVN